MELTCYVYPGWAPRIRAASSRRPWMDDTPDSFAYRCLPLNIANAHGWEILSPCGFEAEWNGGPGVGDVVVRPDAGSEAGRAPVALFGQGVLHRDMCGRPASDSWLLLTRSVGRRCNPRRRSSSKTAMCWLGV